MISNHFKKDDRLDEEDIEEMCSVIASDSDNVEKLYPITVKTMTNINDFDIS